MKIDFSDLIGGIPEIDKLVADTALEVTKKITLDVHAEVVRASPVDEGDFRRAWTVETPTSAFGDGRIENNMPYAQALAHGHSKQAPDGWIDNAIEAATRLGGK